MEDFVRSLENDGVIEFRAKAPGYEESIKLVAFRIFEPSGCWDPEHHVYEVTIPVFDPTTGPGGEPVKIDVFPIPADISTTELIELVESKDMNCRAMEKLFTPEKEKPEDGLIIQNHANKKGGL